MDFVLIKSESKQALAGNRLMFLIAILVTVFISGALSGIAGLGILISPVLSAGLFFIGTDLLERKKFDFNRLFDLFKDLNHAIKVIAVYLLVNLIIIGGLFLLIVPGVIWGLKYSQAVYIMIENPETDIMQALRSSGEMMNGYKADLFVFHLSFIGHFILGVLTLGIYFLYFIPYYQIAQYNYYFHLKKVTNPVSNNNKHTNDDFIIDQKDYQI
ncbi:MAG TPA: DUF975 family protein [Bacilli bacterium]|nr:DUF975 family protein [Bacilli bacterium]